jgi:hypothetical protein
MLRKKTHIFFKGEAGAVRAVFLYWEEYIIV